MLKRFAHIHLLIGWLPVTFFTVTALGLLTILLAQCLQRTWKNLGKEAATTAICAIVGFVATWLVSDVFMVFEVSLGWMVIFAVTAGFAALGFLISSLIVTHRWQRVLAAIMIPVAILATALRVDMIYGEYTTIGSIFSIPIYPAFDSSQTHPASMSVDQWKKLVELGTAPIHPAQGQAFTVTIPNTNSQFRARKADIYLPPAALSKRPPALPVFVMLAGQPGSPDRLFTAGGIQTMMNNYAAKHDGLAPIVVSPDQNGASSHNSLCVDSPVYGNAESYLTRDVPQWIRHNLPVATEASMWAIGGFSQGGTCSTQLGARHPQLFGNMLPADGELEPTQGSKDSMIAQYFHGDKQAFQEQVPSYAMSKRAPSHQTLFAGAGSRDPHSIKNMSKIASSAQAAGMDVRMVVAQGHGHDWHTVRASWIPALDWLGERMGLGPMEKPLEEYSSIRLVPIGNQ